MIDLHYWPTPNGKKLTIQLEESGIDYTVIYCEIGRGAQFEEEFLRISPNNRMPAIVDHDPRDSGPPLSVFESGACMMYLAEKTGKFGGRNMREKWEVNQWVMWQMANQGPKTGERGKVTTKVGETLTPFGFTFYRPFQDGSLSVRQVIAFAARGLGGDIKWLLFTAIAIGMFGSATPYFTGKIFDEAVPQADRETLTVFCVALMFSALATAAFKFVQGVTTIRIQSRMQNSVQASVWDRLLNLPVNFYRKYAAGDLSDRASGIDQIQELIAGAGVAAILGSLSGLFYVVQMLTYNMTLAAVAIVEYALKFRAASTARTRYR